MYVGKKPSAGVDAEGAADQIFAITGDAEGLTVINGKLASQVQQCGQELAAHR